MEVRCHKNQPIEKEKYSVLSANLLIPFEYNPNEDRKSLTLYEPDSVDSDTANIKRGLISILEFYDSETKTVAKVANQGSSGRCQEIESKEGEQESTVDSLRFSNLETNCSAGRPHQVVFKGNYGSQGSFCDPDPKINRNIAYKITRSKNGAAPKILIRSNERLRLQSIFTTGLFDELTAKSMLELKEVRDAGTDETPAGAKSQSCLEVRIENKQEEDQTELLKKAAAGFSHLGHCLHRLDTENHLEDQDIAATLLTLTKALNHLNKDSVITLYNGLEESSKTSFFQILGLVACEEKFKAVKELYEKSPELGELLPAFFENIDHKSRSLNAKAAKEVYEFYKKISADKEVDERLKHSVLLSATAAIHESCVRNGKLDDDCPDFGKIFSKISAPSTGEEDEHSTILKVKVIGNLAMKEGAEWVQQIASDRSKPLSLRAEAAWTLVRLAAKHPTLLKNSLFKTFFDRTEDHEIRIAAYVAIAKSAPHGELLSATQYLVDNNENEDRQLVAFVMSTANLKDMKNPEGSKCRNYAERARAVYEAVQNVGSKLGPRDLFDSAVYNLNSQSNAESLLVSVVASKKDVLPRAVYIGMRDPMQNRAYILNAVSDGMFYSSLVQAKKTYDQAKKSDKSENAEVRAALENIFKKVKGAPTDANFSLSLTERVDGIDIAYEKFDNSEALMQKVMSISSGMDRYLRSFHKYNTIKVKTHTESGLRVKFMTTQAAVTSFEIPQFSVGQMARTGVPISFKYSYKFVSKTVYGAAACVPGSKFKFVTGKFSDKAVHLPRNVTMTVMKKQQDQLMTVSVKGKSEPLQGATQKDIFYRALVPVFGNMESSSEYRNLIKNDTRPLDTHTHFQGYMGYHLLVEKTADYDRPAIWNSPLTRISMRYQELEDQIKPYRYKLAVVKDSDVSTPVLSYEINMVHGHKDGNLVQMFAVTFQSPTDPESKSIRFVIGRKIDGNDPNKRNILINYENHVKKLFLLSHGELTMPETKLLIPDVTRGTAEWAAAYPNEKIVMNGKHKFSPTGRKDFSDADIDTLLNGIGTDPDATSTHEFFRTEEQARLFGAGDNTIDSSDIADNIYSQMIARSQAHTKCSIKAWDKLLKFHGYKMEMTILKPLPEQVKGLHRRIKFLLAKRHYGDMSYEIGEKIDDNKMKVFMNSSVNDQRTDLLIQDKTGSQRFSGFASKLIPLVRPSASPVKVFHHDTFNLPVCSINNGIRKEVETFNSRDISIDGMAADCEYLLASNCRGIQNFAVTFNKKDDTFTILYDNKHKIVVTKTGFTYNGEAVPDKSGLVKEVDGIALLSYKGLMGVMLPNRVSVGRETNSPIGYVSASRLFRGRLCGLCGDSGGDAASDAISSVTDFAVSGQCA